MRRLLLAVMATLLAAASVVGASTIGMRIGPVTALRYEGEADVEAHFFRPGEIRPYRSIQEYWTDGNGRVRMDWRMWQGDSMPEPETFLVVGNDVYHRGRPGRSWERPEGVLADIARFQVLSGVPWELEAKDSTRWRVARDRMGRPTSVSSARAHPRLGDVRDSMELEYGDKSPAPERMRLVVTERDHGWRLEAHRVPVRNAVAPPDSFFFAPSTFEREVEPADSIVPDPPITSIAPGIWSIDMEDLETRSLVVEFADHLAVIEASTGSENGERIVDLAKRRWPSKPIRYFLFSHHHPHYMGGVRAFIAEGATVVTTAGNEVAVRAAAARPFTIRPDRLARSPRPVDVRPFTKRFELADATNRLVLIDIGDRSDHTAEFTIFWLPRQKVLFEAEQGWLEHEGRVRPTRRTKKFLATLAEENVAPDRFVQSWPMRGAPGSLTRAELDSLLVPRKP